MCGFLVWVCVLVVSEYVWVSCVCVCVCWLSEYVWVSCLCVGCERICVGFLCVVCVCVGCG